METSTFVKEFAEYKIEDYGTHTEVYVSYKNVDSIYDGDTFKVFSTDDYWKDTVEWIAVTEKKCKMFNIIDAFTQNMEGYTYHDANNGISENNYDEIIDKIIKEFNI